MSAPKTKRLECRITTETETQIQDLSKLWGPHVSLNQSQVAEKAIRMAWEREKRKKGARAS